MTVKQRHIKTNSVLNKSAQHILQSKNTKKIISPLALKYDVSLQTILNYLHGMGSDGFLKEALIEDVNLIKYLK